MSLAELQSAKAEQRLYWPSFDIVDRKGYTHFFRVLRAWGEPLDVYELRGRVCVQCSGNLTIITTISGLNESYGAA
jgi:hypothetical protein